MFDWEILDNYATRILDAKYKQVNINRVAADKKYLNDNQHHKLQHLLAKNKKLFDWSLGVYPHQKVHIDLLPKLVHRAYPVPWVQEQTFKKELQHMVDIGILEECRASEWALSCFIVAKRDGRVRQISDLCSLNKYIKGKQYLLPIIHEIMQQISGYNHFTKLNISMQYHSFELDL